MDDRLVIYIGVVADVLKTPAVGCWAVTPERLELRAQMGVDQKIIDAVDAAWRNRGAALTAGQLVPAGAGAVWPLTVANAVVGLLYVGCDRFTDEARQAAESMARSIWRFDGGPGAVLPVYDAEVEDLRTALRITAGNLSATARRLGVSRQTVYSRCNRHGINPESFRG